MEGLTEGRIVHIKLKGVDHCIPAIVVRVWPSDQGTCNVRAFFDGTNDHPTPTYFDGWITSITFGEPAENYRWHWPERA